MLLFWFFTIFYMIIMNLGWRGEEKSTKSLMSGIFGLAYAFILYLFMQDGISDAWDMLTDELSEYLYEYRYDTTEQITYVFAAFMQLIMLLYGIIGIPAYFYYRSQEQAQITQVQMQEEITKLRKEMAGGAETPAEKKNECIPAWKRVEMETKPVRIEMRGSNTIMCPKCGSTQRADRTRCWQCDTPFEKKEQAERVCRSCGGKLIDQAAFCSHCGAKVE